MVWFSEAGLVSRSCRDGAAANGSGPSRVRLSPPTALASRAPDVRSADRRFQRHASPRRARAHGRALAAGEHETVDARDLVLCSDLARPRAELRQHVDVLLDATLQRQDADERARLCFFAHDGALAAWCDVQS